jgi:hypothetical protein
MRRRTAAAYLRDATRATGNTQDLDIFSGLVISNKKRSSNLEGSTL